MLHNLEDRRLIAPQHTDGKVLRGTVGFAENPAEIAVNEHHSSGCPKTWKVAVVVFLMCALFLAGIVVGYSLAQAWGIVENGASERPVGNEVKNRKEEEHSAEEDNDPMRLVEFHNSVLDLIVSKNSILENLTNFASIQIQSGSVLDQNLVDLINSDFKSMNLDDVTVETYDTLISIPNPKKPNRFRAFQKNLSEALVDEIYHNQQGNFLPGYVAYSPSDDIQGEVVFLNRGDVSDFKMFSKSEQLQGKVALIQAGEGSLSTKVKLAECYGMLGVLIYDDQHIHNGGAQSKRCSSHVPYGIVSSHEGDPLTRGYPALDGFWRISAEKSNLPSIPIQTISCQSASKILPLIKTDHLSNVTTKGLTVRLEVNNQLVRRPVRNVMVTMFGDKDSDYNVLVGASRNSFNVESQGGMDGTILLLKLGHALSGLYHNDHEHWIPKRTIRLISWGGGDFGHLGLVEFLEKYSNIWRGKVVTYIDLDKPVSTPKKDSLLGTSDDIMATSTVSLENWVMAVFDQVQSVKPSFPDVTFFSHRMTEWSRGMDRQVSDIVRRRLNAPYVHLQMDWDASATSPHLAASAARDIVAGAAASLTLAVADSGVTPLKIHRTVHEVSLAVNRAIMSFGGFLPNATTSALRTNLHQIKNSVSDLESFISEHLAYEQEGEVRMVNGAMLEVEVLLDQILVDLMTIHDTYNIDGLSLTKFDSDFGECISEIEVDDSFLVTISNILGLMISAVNVMMLGS